MFKEARARQMTDYFSLRVNAKLKEDFYNYCKGKGFTAGKALKLLARQFAKSGKIPFSLETNRNYPDDNFVRASIHMDAETRQHFADACEEYGLPMSIVVRGFMDYCVSHDAFPYVAGDKKK